MQVEVIDKRLVDLGPVVLQRSEPMWRDWHFAGLDAKRLRDIGGGRKDRATFCIDFHSRVGRNRSIERGGGFVVKILALEAISD